MVCVVFSWKTNQTIFGSIYSNLQRVDPWLSPKVAQALEANLIWHDRHEMLLLSLRKALTYGGIGSPEQCALSIICLMCALPDGCCAFCNLPGWMKSSLVDIAASKDNCFSQKVFNARLIMVRATFHRPDYYDNY